MVHSPQYDPWAFVVGIEDLGFWLLEGAWQTHTQGLLMWSSQVEKSESESRSQVLSFQVALGSDNQYLMDQL